MTIELLLVQFLVLAFTAALWWIARRDLAARAASPLPAPAETHELEQLCATLEALVTDLSRRLERLEEQQDERQPNDIGARFIAPPVAAAPSGAMAAQDAIPFMQGTAISAPAQKKPEPDDTQEARYAPVYALLDEGVTASEEIARRTGLSRGEIDLILSLRARRAL